MGPASSPGATGHAGQKNTSQCSPDCFELHGSDLGDEGVQLHRCGLGEVTFKELLKRKFQPSSDNVAVSVSHSLPQLPLHLIPVQLTSRRQPPSESKGGPLQFGPARTWAEAPNC
eukprot:3422990-Amphidinium_carterae.1